MLAVCDLQRLRRRLFGKYSSRVTPQHSSGSASSRRNLFVEVVSRWSCMLNVAVLWRCLRTWLRAILEQ